MFQRTAEFTAYKVSHLGGSCQWEQYTIWVVHFKRSESVPKQLPVTQYNWNENDNWSVYNSCKYSRGQTPYFHSKYVKLSAFFV